VNRDQRTVIREQQAGNREEEARSRGWEYVLVTVGEVLQNKMRSEFVMCKTEKRDAIIMAQS
jgi:hypothetical protein